MKLEMVDDKPAQPKKKAVKRKRTAKKTTNKDIQLYNTTPIAANTANTPLDDPIFKTELFATPTNDYKIKPTQLYNILVSYMIVPDSLESIVEKHGFSVESVYALRHKYPAILKAYDYARSQKADIWAGISRDQYLDIPEDAYELDKYGQKRLSQAYVTLMRDKAAVLSRAAALANRDKYSDKHIVEQRNLNLNISANVSTDQLQSMVHNIDDMLNT